MTARVTGIHGRICWSADLTAPTSGTGSPPLTLEPNDVCAPHSTPTMSQRTQTDSASRAFIRGGAERWDGAEKRWLLLSGTACCRVNCLDCHPDQRQRRGISSAVLVAGPRVMPARSLVAVAPRDDIVGSTGSNCLLSTPTGHSYWRRSPDD